MNYLHIGHPWICENGVAPDRALDPAVLSRLKQFSAMNKLKKMALRVRTCLTLLFLAFTTFLYDLNMTDDIIGLIKK